MRFLTSLLLVLILSTPALASHKPDHQCTAIDAFETELKQKNPDLIIHSTQYNKLIAMKFIAFSYMELGIQPPNENPDLITGLYFMYAEGQEKGFVAIMNGNSICSNSMINKKAFELIIQSLTESI